VSVQKHSKPYRQCLVIALCLMSVQLNVPANVVADGLNACGFRLLKALGSPAGTNPTISPASIGLAVGLAYLGSKGETRAEIAKVFGWERSGETAVEQFFSSLSRRNESSSDQFTFEIGNSLWLDQSFAFNPHYQHIAEQELGATVKAIDFSTAG